jgi:NhaP-type Na+/H+ or K+/H+ antiporter
MEDFNLLIYLGLFFLISQIFGRVANFFRAPRLIGYLVAGIVFGPYVLQVFSLELVEQMDLFTEMALAIIAFSIGASLKLEKIKSKKKVILGIAFLQAITCWIIVTASLFSVLYFFYTYEAVQEILGVCILLGAISAATAPAAILSIIHEYKAKGKITTVLLGTTAVDDAITLILYAFAFSIAEALVTDSAFSTQSGIIEPLLDTVYAIVFGLVVGLMIKAILRYFPNKEVLLGIMIGAVFFIAGIAQKFGFSHLLPIMVFAFYIENTEKRLAQKSYDSVKKIEEPILGVFFLLAGAHLNLLQAISAGTLVLTMVLARGIAKYGGTRIASKYTKAEEKVKKYAGLASLQLE